MSTHPASERPPLNQRPRQPHRARDDFESLDEAHRAALAMLDAFQRLLAHLEDEGQDARAEQCAAEVLAFFNGPGRHHHADEERLVFPEIEALGDAELAGHVRRLRQDHHWIDLDWRELAPHIQAVAEGYNGYDLPLLQAALPVFEALYLDHMALEETVVFPAARRLREAAAARRRTAS